MHFSNTSDAEHASTHHQMVFDGSGSSANGDSLVVLACSAASDGSTSWGMSGTATHDGVTYDVYTSANAADHAQLLIEHSLKVNTAML